MVTTNLKAPISAIDFTKFRLWDADQIDFSSSGVDRYLIDMTREYPPVDFLLEYNGVGCIPKGDLQAITGKMKSGKSFACSCLEAAMLKGDFMGFTALHDNITILHIDTEQSKATIAKRAKTVHTMCEWSLDDNDERYRVLALRECDFGERLRRVVEAVEQYKPDFVIIDGIRDLLADFNDPKESATLIDSLMKLCNESGAGIMCVLHENKNDGNMRGHLGTELGNKCSEIFKVSNINKVLNVEQTVCRNEPIDKWAFSIDQNGVPKPDILTRVNKVKVRRDSCFMAIFQDRQSYTHTELWKAFAELYGCKEKAAQNNITSALIENVLHKEGTRYYLAPYVPFNLEESNA